MIWTLFVLFFKIGLTCFGGGYGMMAMILDEGQKMVGLTTDEFANLTALDMVCPGAVALNSATYVGYLKGGVAGAAAATFGLCLPTIVISIIVIVFLKKFHESRIVRGLFRGITPACAGLLIYTCITLFTGVFFGTESVFELKEIAFTPDIIAGLILFAAAFILQFKYKTDTMVLTLIGAAAGLIFMH